MGRNKRLKKEEIAEDWCFVCKDGGPLRICDHRDCLKVYHPQCVGKDDSLLLNEDQWVCNWHFCSVCRKASNFRCLCCPSAVCKHCLDDAQFAVIKTDKGFCNSCLHFASLIEMKKDANFDGCKIDFNDPDTMEFFFNGYWQITKKKEGLTSEHVISAYNLLKNSEVYKHAADSYDEGEEDSDEFEDGSLYEMSDSDDSIDIEEYKLPLCWCRKRKRTKGEMSAKKEKANEKEWKKEYSNYMDNLLWLPSDQLHSLHEVQVVLAETQDAEQDPNDGIQESYHGRTSKAVPSSRPSTAIFESDFTKAKEAAPLSQAAITVSEPEQKAVTIEIIGDVKEEMEEINPLAEAEALFAKLQPMLDESLKELPQSSRPPLVSPDEINEAKHCLHLCGSMNFEQLMHHGQKDQFLSSLNLLLSSGYFAESMLGEVTTLQLNFLSNTSLYSRCMESVRKADEEKEHTASFRKEVVDKRSHFHQIVGNIQVEAGEIQKLRGQAAEIRKKLAEKRKFTASLEAQAKGIAESSRASGEALLQSIQSSKMLEKSKQSSLKLMQDIDASWKRFQSEILKLL